MFMMAAMWLPFVTACAGPSNRITDYLVGFEPPARQQHVVLPVIVGLVIALPEEELGKPTTPSLAAFEGMTQRIQKELEESPLIRVGRVFPAFVIPASGHAALSLERLRLRATDPALSQIIVAVPTSQGARKGRFGGVEDQLFARMDAALVDLATGRMLVGDTGQDDYVLAQSYFYNSFSYPRLYYRTFTFAGPFTVVTGDPFKALGIAAFSGAADQIGMKLRQLVDPTPQARVAVTEASS
jgi:hypothetical protein